MVLIYGLMLNSTVTEICQEKISEYEDRSGPLGGDGLI